MARIRGTDGRDVRSGGNAADEMVMLGGDDSAYGNGGDDRIYGGDGRDSLFGGTGRDTLYGGNGRDQLYGQDGNDTLYGDAGFDQLSGGAGNDVLNGGPGSDDLIGGAGADIFQYLSATGDNAPNGDQFVDFIFDFSLADGDRIGVEQIDANPYRAGDQDFRFIGSRGFTGNGGEARFQWERDPAGDAQTRVEFDVDGDRVSDLSVLLVNGFINLKADDFYL